MLCNFMTITDCTSVLLKFLFSNLDYTFAKELAAGNVNTKNLEKVNSFPVFTKVAKRNESVDQLACDACRESS